MLIRFAVAVVTAMLIPTTVATSCQPIGKALRSCSADAISLPYMPGTVVYAVTAEKILDYSVTAQIANPQIDYDTTINFCNVTISYGHQGWYDNVTVTVWLPLSGWTGRLSGIGGAGFSSVYTWNRFAPAVDNGWAAVGTDAGHDHSPLSAGSWALDTSGRINYFLLENFFASSQDEAARIGKKTVQDLYGESPSKSYWDGCSTGGRQGFLLA